MMATSAMAVTIGFSQVGDEGDWRPAFSKDMQDEAKKEGIDLKFADAQGKEEEQLKAVRAFIAQKVDAIIIAPVVVTGWDQVLREAKRVGIPVFLADRDVDVTDKSLFVARISADFNLEGRLAGAWLAQASKGSCNIVEEQGTTGSAPAIERKKGFEAVISNFPSMKIVKTQSGDFTTDGGKKVMEAFIKSTDNLKGVCASFAHNDNMQLGAVQAMKEAGLKPGKDVLMVSVDYVPAMKRRARQGRGQRLGRAALRHRQIHLSRRGRLSEEQDGTAEVGGDPVRPAHGRDAGQLNRALSVRRRGGFSPTSRLPSGRRERPAALLQFKTAGGCA